MKIQRSIILFLFIAVIILLRYSYHAYQVYRDDLQARSRVNLAHGVIKNLEQVQGASLKIESDSRGYVITGKESFAASCYQAAGVINKEMAALRKLIRDNPAQQRNLDTLSPLINRKVSFCLLVIAARDRSFPSALALMNKDYGIQLTDSIANRINLMLTEENRLLDERVEINNEVGKKALNISLAAATVVMILLILFLYRLNKDIQRRKHAEAEAKNSELKYRRLIENARVVMFTTDINGYFTFISDRVKALTGFRKEELLGQAYSMLVPPEWLDRLRSHYQLQLRERKPESTLEFPIVTKDKTLKWVEQIGVIQYNNEERIAGMQFIVKDIEEQRRAREELERSEQERKENQERLQSILDNSTSLVYIKDVQGRYLLINKKFESVFQTTNRHLKGKTDYELHEKTAADRYSEADRWVILHQKPREIEEILEQPDGTHHYMIVKFPLFDTNHQVYGLCGIATDISERIRYEEELVEARKIAENAEKLQEQFLANMSHDIRTPLTGIIGMADLISGTALNGEQTEFADGIKQAAGTLMVLVNDILDLSKIKAGKLDIECIPFNLPACVSKALYTLKQRANEKGVQFHLIIDPSIPAALKGDPYRLSQVLVNLTGNSVKFTDKGSIRVSVRAGLPEENGIRIYFSVKDTGIGIPSDKINTIFESFTQSASDTARKYGGSGLGLAIVKQLIKLLGGEVNVRSEMNSGSEFYFILPYTLPGEKELQILSEASEDGRLSPGELEGIRLLVAEDDPVNRKMISFILKKAGVWAELVENGRELTGRLQSGGKYDLILSDIHMPEMDGYEAARFIRHSLRLDIPIIAMTATVLRDERNLCFEAGMNDYLSKPFSINELIGKIRQNVHPIRPADPEDPNVPESSGLHLYDLGYLEEMQDPEYMKEVLDTFLSTTPPILEEIRSAVQQREWQEIRRKAHRLSGTFGMLKIQDMKELLVNLENQAKDQERPELMQELIERAISLYGKIHVLLEKEKNSL